MILFKRFRPGIVIIPGMLLALIFMVSPVRGGDPPSRCPESFHGRFKPFHPSALKHQAHTTDTADTVKLPSKGRAFLYSLLIPGAGEYYAGSKKMAKVFFISEGLLWATYFSFRTYGHWKENDYRRFAVTHAGVDLNGKDHQYFVDIENYNNIQEFNEAKLRQRDVDAMYPENDFYGWQWDSGASRKRFERIRIASDKAFNNSLLVIGGIVLNHLISGIDALSAARRRTDEHHNRIKLGVMGLPEGGAVVTVLKIF